MRLVYLNSDRGIPLLGSKGASIHVRASLRAFAPCVERLTAVCARIDPKAPPRSDPAELPARIIGPFGGGSDVADTLVANDDALVHLASLYDHGDMDVVYERLSLWGVAGAEAARQLGVPWFVEANAPLVQEAASHRNLGGRRVAEFVQRSILRRATGVVVVSEELRRWALAEGVEEGRILVAPNGCNPNGCNPNGCNPNEAHPTPAGAHNGSAGHPFTIVFVGSLKPWHGTDTLVDAFVRFHARCPQSRLVIVGDGPSHDAIRQRLTATLPPSAFLLTGAISHRDVSAHLGTADVAVAPYPEIEGFYFSPLKVIEYCAAGTPIVASRIGQIADTLTHGENALLVEPGNAAALTKALHQLHDDPDLRKRLGDGAREVAKQRSWSRITRRIVDWMEARIEAGREAEPAGAPS